MLMICWFYCIPFAKLLYFALSPLLFVFALFMLKRGLRRARTGLRQGAFLVMFLSIVKLFVFDIRMLRQEIMCGKAMSAWPQACSGNGFKAAELGGLLLLFFCSLALFHFYRIYLPNVKRPALTADDVNLRSWANVSLVSVSAMIIWTLAPWVGFLTVGSVPALFSVVQWQHFAIANLVLLLIGFWKAESCDWGYHTWLEQKGGQPPSPARGKAGAGRHATRHNFQTDGGWTPRDTLWLNVFLYLITLALSYVGHDVLASHARG